MTQVAAGAVLQPGKNCWTIDRADAVYCVQDAAPYFALVRRALLAARDSVFILGWDFASTIDLDPGGDASEAPTRLDDLLAFITKRRPQLRCYVLTWDYGSLYTLEREPLTRWRIGWRTARRVTFGFDDHHPVAASHHQKVIVVDDQLAFCGSIDLTSHRWDRTEHRLDEPARKTTLGQPYDPYHEVQMMVSGPIAAKLGELARDRWRAFGAEVALPAAKERNDLWPSDIIPDISDVDVAIARTLPPSERQPAIRECETLFHDSIAMAKQSIYIENQYFTDETLTERLAERLDEPDGPEVIVVVPKECAGWLERQSMGAFRDAVFAKLKAADRYQRLRLVYPIASRAKDVPTFIHSKVMIVDDELVRVGSANCARRSMGLDSECDVAIEARGDDRIRKGITRIRNRLLAEHLGMRVDDVAGALSRAGSLRALIDARQGNDRTLTPVEAVTDQAGEPSAAIRATIDPPEPIGFGTTVTQLVPPIEATGKNGPLRLWILPAIAIIAAVASSSAVFLRPELAEIQETLTGTSTLPSALLVGTGAFVVAGLLLVPIELLTIVAAVAFGALRGAMIAAIASLLLAVIGYAVGKKIGADGVARWVSRRSYRSVRQLGAHGIIGVIVLRLSSVASSGAIHLLCGAGAVPFSTFLAGSIAAGVPAIAILSALGGMLRDTILEPSVANGMATIAATVFLLMLASLLRTLLLIRQFAPGLAHQRQRAEFG